MARYESGMYLSRNPVQVFNEVHKYLIGQGYNYEDFKGERLFKKGYGVVSAPTFIKLIIDNGALDGSQPRLTLQAWLKYAWMPGVYSGEMDLTGAMGFAVKSTLKSRVIGVESIIYGTRVTQPGVPPAGYERLYLPPDKRPRTDNVQSQSAAHVSSNQPTVSNVQPQQAVQPQTQQAVLTEQFQPTAKVRNFCVNCGAKLNPGDRFCANCGSKLD